MPTQFMPLKKGSTFISPLNVSLLSSVPVMMITDFNTSLIANKMDTLHKTNRIGFTEYTRVPKGERHNLYTERVHHGIIDSRANIPTLFRNIDDNVASFTTKTTDNVFTMREFNEPSVPPPPPITRRLTSI
jgi:hypothetical protein